MRTPTLRLANASSCLCLTLCLVAATHAVAEEDQILCFKAKDLLKAKPEYSFSSLVSSVQGGIEAFACSGKAKLKRVCISGSRNGGDDPNGGAVTVAHACYKVKCDGAVANTSVAATTAFAQHQFDVDSLVIRKKTDTLCLPIAELP